MISIEQFGARPNTGEVQTQCIQAAIDSCAAAGGGTVLVPTGKFTSGTLLLKSHVTLHLENGAVLFGSPNLEDYRTDTGMFVDAVDQKRGRCLVYAEGATSVAIEGKGTIDGNGSAYTRGQHDRPFLVRFKRCEHVSMTGVTLRDSAGWVSHYFECDHVRIMGVTIHSHVNENNDGIDIDSCSNVQVLGCDIDTGDDAICIKSTGLKACENVVVTGCSIKSDWGALKLGTESVGDFRNIILSDCVIRETRGGGVKLISMDGCRMENVTVSNIVFDRVSGPIFLRLGRRLRSYYPGEKRDVPGIMKNITLSNISGTVWEEGFALWGFNRRSGVLITGVPGHCIENLHMENIRLTFPGGGTVEERERLDVPEHEEHYPEFPIFHPLPSYGFYVRHVNGVSFRNIQLETQTPDARPPIVFTDVKKIAIERLDAPAPEGIEPIRYL